MNQLATTGGKNLSHEIGQTEDTEDYVTFTIDKQLFGIPVLKVQDILSPDRIARIPLAPPEVAGSINLRGRIVTVIDVRTRLGLKKRETPRLAGPEGEADAANSEPKVAAKTAKRRTGLGAIGMGVTVEHKNDLYTFLVDSVGEVLSVKQSDYERTPSTLNPTWREFSAGVYRLKGRLMVVLDVEQVLDINV